MIGALSLAEHPMVRARVALAQLRFGGGCRRAGCLQKCHQCSETGLLKCCEPSDSHAQSSEPQSAAQTHSGTVRLRREGLQSRKELKPSQQVRGGARDGHEPGKHLPPTLAPHGLPMPGHPEAPHTQPPSKRSSPFPLQGSS